MSADKAKLIRKEIKETLGLNARKVSVRSPHYGCVRVEIKDEETNEHYEAIQEIARNHESISRCEYTGEILSGGNSFVFVSRYRVAW